MVAALLAGCGTSRSLKRAEQHYARGEYFEAARHYKKAYTSLSAKERTKRGEVAFRLATCYRLTNYAGRAKAAYTNAIRYNYPDSMALFYLAESQRKCGEYKAAAKSYTDFLSLAPDNRLAASGLASCSLVEKMKQSPSRYRVKREQSFLSARADYSPMFLDADRVYFTSTRKEAKGDDLNSITGMKSADLFVARRDEKGHWMRPEVIDSEINSDAEEGACSFTPDGRTIYFTRCRTSLNSDMAAEIYRAQRADAAWGAAERCMLTNDTLSTVAHPAVSTKGNFLYFVSDMPGGYGGLDIWRINIVNGVFGYVDNLGPEINTAGNEMFPTFSPDGTLYFSSDGHPGMGGLDIFSARLDSVTGKWRVENMGTPLNSSADDFGMTFNPRTPNEGLFSSNRSDAAGRDHIYSFLLPVERCSVSGVVVDSDGDGVADATVTLVGDDGTYERIAVKRDGSFSHKLKPGSSYVMLAAGRGHLNSRQELTTDGVDVDRCYEVNFTLASITRPVLIENIFYEFNSAELTKASTAALNELVRLLNDNPNIAIELSSHCDYKGEADYNERLSQRRAESVVRYLVKSGIDEGRLTAKGYGESQPKRVNRVTQQRLPFLKVGTELTEEFVKSLPEEQQEQCNAVNRRTEFRVVSTTYVGKHS
jgi:outer membrane protein OmpA-like peptidoglycan-associated protein